MIFKFWDGAKYLSGYKNRGNYRSDRYLARFVGKIDSVNVHVEILLENILKDIMLKRKLEAILCS